MIRDARLGITKYLSMFAIFVYVVIYDIFYLCDHLAPHHADGFGTISMQHPVDNCDELDKECLALWHNIAKLPYCSQYTGKEGERLLEEEDKEEDGKEEKDEKEDDKGDKDEEEDGKSEKKKKVVEKVSKECPNCGKLITKKKMCRYLDNRRLEWASGTPSEIFVPTHYKQIKQKINHDCYNPAVDDSLTEPAAQYRCKSPYTTVSEHEFYIADIDRYELKMSHSFNSPQIGLFGVSTEFQGLFAACPTNHPPDMLAIKSECVRTKVPDTKGDIAPEDDEGLSTVEDMDIPSLHGAPSGEDVISLADLLKVTPVAQKFKKIRKNVLDSQLPDDFGHKGKSIRENGGMLLLDVNYNNNGYLRPGFPGTSAFNMGIKPVTYLYRPYFVPTNKNLKYQLVQGSDHSETRTIDIWYGITIKMQFNGQLVQFTMAKLLKSLTAGLVLLTAATSLVVALASYLLPLQEKYNGLMYQMSEDLSDYKKFRSDRVGCLGSFINPLGMLDGAKAWSVMQSTFVSGTMLWKYLSTDGTPNKELPNSEIIKILCMNEMRLNRLDAMDTRILFNGSDEAKENAHRVKKVINSMYSEFYTSAQADLKKRAQGDNL